MGHRRESWRHDRKSDVAWSSKDYLWSVLDLFFALESKSFGRHGNHRFTDFDVSQDKVPLAEKLDQILRWIDFPLDTRPQLIMGK